MSLQATEACIIEMDKEGAIVKSEDIPVELVQRGDLLKVRLWFWYIAVYFSIIHVCVCVCVCVCAGLDINSCPPVWDNQTT